MLIAAGLAWIGVTMVAGPRSVMPEALVA